MVIVVALKFWVLCSGLMRWRKRVNRTDARKYLKQSSGQRLAKEVEVMEQGSLVVEDGRLVPKVMVKIWDRSCSHRSCGRSGETPISGIGAVQRTWRLARRVSP